MLDLMEQSHGDKDVLECAQMQQCCVPSSSSKKQPIQQVHEQVHEELAYRVPVVSNLLEPKHLTDVDEVEDVFLKAATTKSNRSLQEFGSNT